MKVKYSIEDVKVLEELYRKEGFSISAGTLRDSGYKMPSRSSNFWYTEQSDFLFNTPFKDVPMVIHVGILKHLIEWRLRIGK